LLAIEQLLLLRILHNLQSGDEYSHHSGGGDDDSNNNNNNNTFRVCSVRRPSIAAAASARESHSPSAVAAREESACVYFFGLLFGGGYMVGTNDLAPATANRLDIKRFGGLLLHVNRRRTCRHRGGSQQVKTIKRTSTAHETLWTATK